jgi:hypothetical protein
VVVVAVLIEETDVGGTSVAVLETDEYVGITTVVVVLL